MPNRPFADALERSQRRLIEEEQRRNDDDWFVRMGVAVVVGIVIGGPAILLWNLFGG